MKSLIVEDDFVSAKTLQILLSPYSQCDRAANGKEALDAIALSFEQGTPYDLICLDIMMPDVDGLEVLKQLRRIESEKNVSSAAAIKVIMVSALNDSTNVLGAFKEGCEAYMTKPISKQKLVENLLKLGLTKDK